MWRLIAFILICAIFLAFVALNLENKSDVSFGFRTFTEIPVFFTAFASFVFGMLFAIPFVLSFGRKRKKPPPHDHLLAEEERQAASPGISGPKGGKSARKKPPSNTGKAERDPASPSDEVKKESSPYGID